MPDISLTDRQLHTIDQIAHKTKCRQGWSQAACVGASDYLRRKQIPHQVVVPSDTDVAVYGFRYGQQDEEIANDHCWLQLQDATIIDPTISQFAAQQTALQLVWPGTATTAVLRPGHPLRRRYLADSE